MSFRTKQILAQVGWMIACLLSAGVLYMELAHGQMPEGVEPRTAAVECTADLCIIAKADLMSIFAANDKMAKTLEDPPKCATLEPEPKKPAFKYKIERES